MTFKPVYPNAGTLDRVVVSVIIPAFNSKRFLAPCLTSLTELAYQKELFEVIVVDNGSSDQTVAIAESFCSSLNLTILQKVGVRVSAVRNVGAAQARGNIFAFLDSDCLAPRLWLTRGPDLLAKAGVGVAGAHFRIPDNSGWVARAWYGESETEKQGNVSWVPGCNTLVTRATFERFKGFDESIETNEDCEFCFRVRDAGLQVIADAAIAVVHLGIPETLSVFYRKTRWHGTDGMRVFLREFPKMSNAKPLLFAFYTLLCLAGLAGGAWLALRHKTCWVAGVFAAALCIPPFMLAGRVAVRRRQGKLFFPLALLYLLYGIAKGRAVLDVRNWFDRAG